MAVPEPSFRLIPREDAALVEGADGSLEVHARRFALGLGVLPRGTADAVRLVFEAGATEADLVGLVLERDGMSAVPGLLLVLGRLDRSLVLGRAADSAEGPFVSVVPTTGPVAPETGELGGQGERWRMSRFVSWRRTAVGVVLESPLARGRLTLHEEAAAVIAYRLSAGATLCDLRSSLCGVPDATLFGMLRLVAAAGLLEQGDEEDGAHPLAQWEHHDLAFHARSRLGRHHEPYGGTYRFDGVTDPLPAAHPVGLGDVLIDLPVAVPGASGSLAETMALRTSVRRQGEPAISLAQLATFLHRCQRLDRTIPTPQGELASRPYPGGGALYELEVYPVVDRCAGLDPGLYHYVSDRHQLRCVAGSDELVRRLLEEAWLTLALADRPQILLVITARFGRVMWKYQSMAYALILKDVGLLFQTMYLVATDMGLAPCALGGGDSELFARASHLDYLIEGSVGEFTLGSRPPGEPVGATAGLNVVATERG